MAKIRTFVAVDVSPSIRASAARLMKELEASGAGYRWCQPENLHVTLNFLGDVLENETPQVCRLVAQACQDVTAFPIEVSQLDCLPKWEKPRVIWLRVTEGADRLADLSDRIANRLEEMRFPRERLDYQPHMTLGRIQRGGHWNQALQDTCQQYKSHLAGGCIINQVIVYSSFLDRTGPSYTPMSRIALS